MAKFARYSKLPKKDREDLIWEFCEALVAIKKTKEAANFIKDILTEQEIEMLAKRLRIARLLIEGETYEEIGTDLKVSYGTIARVSEWLRVSGEGYRMIVKRVEKKDHYEKDYYDESRAFKRRFSLYYWPELLVEDLASKADKKQREMIRSSLKIVGKKSKLYRKLDEIVKRKILESGEGDS